MTTTDLHTELAKFLDAAGRLPKPARWLLRRGTRGHDPVAFAELFHRASVTGTPVTVADLENLGVPSYAAAASLRSMHELLSRAGKPEVDLVERPRWRQLLPRPRQVFRMLLAVFATQLLLIGVLIALFVGYWFWRN